MQVEAKLERPLVAIILLNWNGLEDTLECLGSLEKLSYPSVQVIVVDNGSEGDQAAAIADAFPEAVVLPQAENLGFCGGCNVGIKYVLEHGADYVMLLNNDALATPDLIVDLMDGLALCPNAAAVSPVILEYPDTQKIWFSDARWVAVEAQFRLTRREITIDGMRNEPFVTGFACGCCMFVSKELLHEVGLLDERYFAFYEEADWCSRARRLGYEAYVIPTATAYHKVSRSTPSLVSTYLLTRNRLLWMRENLSISERLKSLRYLLREYIWHRLHLMGLTRGGFSKNHSRAILAGYRDYFLRRFYKWDEAVEAVIFS